jgi:hypothetical protein
MFFARMSQGWEMAKQSWHVLKQDKELLWFPIFSGIAAILVLISFALPVFFVPGLQDFIPGFADKGGRDGYLREIAVALLAFGFYFLNYFIIVYFNTALVACAVVRFRGGDPNVRLGLQMANKRLPQIFGWSLLAASVGFILRMVEEKSEWVGRIVISIIGFMWTTATFLVVPTLAVEGLGPIDALKRSGGLIRKVWGEGFAGNLGIGLIGFLLSIPAIAVVFLAIAAQLPPILLGTIVALAVVYGLGVAVVTSALQQIFLAGLYIYATEKKVPRGFDDSLMQNAFVPRQR